MQNLQKLRIQIDKIDEKLMKDLAARFAVTEKVGVLKKKLNLPIHDAKREAEVVASKIQMGEKFKINPVLVEKIFKLIMEYAKKRHKEIRAIK